MLRTRGERVSRDFTGLITVQIPSSAKGNAEYGSVSGRISPTNTLKLITDKYLPSACVSCGYPVLINYLPGEHSRAERQDKLYFMMPAAYARRCGIAVSGDRADRASCEIFEMPYIYYMYGGRRSHRDDHKSVVCRWFSIDSPRSRQPDYSDSS